MSTTGRGSEYDDGEELGDDDATRLIRNTKSSRKLARQVRCTCTMPKKQFVILRLE